MPKRPDPYYQANITRRDLVILREEKRRNDGRNIIIIIILPLSFLFSQLLLLPLTPELLESEIPAKYLDHEALDPPPDLTEPEPNTPRK
jgi:hypothetical protein